MLIERERESRPGAYEVLVHYKKIYLAYEANVRLREGRGVADKAA